MGAPTGRPRSSSRQWVENCSIFDVAESRQSCREVEYWNRPPRSVFLAKPDSPWRKVKLKLTATQPNYGGTRFWFICPRPGCERRVAKIYVDDSGLCGCRVCLDLVYECQYRKSAKYWQLACIREMWRNAQDPTRSRKALYKAAARALRDELAGLTMPGRGRPAPVNLARAPA
jgi:hypothetical protein